MSEHSAIRRDVGAFALMLTGLGSIIGSGWLFGAWHAAQLAGPGRDLGVGDRRRDHHDDRADLCRARRDVPRIRRHGALRPLFARLAGRLHRGVVELDRDRLGDSGRGRSVGAVHGVLAVALGAGSVSCTCPAAHGELTHARPRDRRGAGGRVFPGQLLEREALRAHEFGDHVVQAGRAGRDRRSR